MKNMFLTLNFNLDMLINILTIQLDLVVRMYAQHFFPMKTFPFATTIRARNGIKICHGT